MMRTHHLLKAVCSPLVGAAALVVLSVSGLACAEAPAARTAAADASQGGAMTDAAGDSAASGAMADTTTGDAADEKADQPAGSMATMEGASAAEKPAATTAAKPKPAIAPPPGGGEWLVDEQGRRYELMEYPKNPYNFRRLDNGKVRIRYGLEFDVAEETDEALWLKVYDPNQLQSAGAEAAAREKEPTAWPEPQAGASDRLVFAAFDQGLPKKGQWREGFDVADMNGDGHLDIVHGPVRKGPTKPQIFLGDGQGTWRLWREASYPDFLLDYGDAAVGDFNEDGVPDLALAVHLRGVVAMVAGPDGAFSLWNKGLPYNQPERHEGVAPFSSRSLEVVDWNGDGRPDLLVLGEGPQITGMSDAGKKGAKPTVRKTGRGAVLFLDNGDGSWTRVDGSEDDASFGDSLALGDFNGDGRTDFAASTNRYGWTGIVKLGQADGSWRSVPIDALGSTTLVRGLAAGDFDHDGKDELVIGYTSHSETLGWRSGIDELDRADDGTWTRTALVGRDSAEGVWSLAVGDLDADGHLDVVGTWGDGDVSVLAGTAGGFTLDSAKGLDGDDPYCRGYHVELANLDGKPGDEVVIGFAGEPGSEVMFQQGQRCVDGGGLHAWRLER